MKDTVMKCDEICELMPDVAAGLATADSEVNQHLSSCATCAGKLDDLRKTMALLDEWTAPEPSPFFDTRMRARMREEMTPKASGWMHWFRRPALAVSLAIMMVTSITLFHNSETNKPKTMVQAVTPDPGSAVGDLQALDKNDELYSNFDVLDDLQVQPDVNANP